MKKQYYVVKLLENIDIYIFCEVVGVTDTQKYGFAYIFRDIITQKIIRPYYDTTLDKIYNISFGTLTYDNIKKEYSKVSKKEVLNYLKTIDSDFIEKQNKLLNALEEIALEEPITRIK